MRQKRMIRTIIITFILTALVVGGVFFFLMSNKEKGLNEQIKSLEAQQADKFYWVFAEDLKPGSVITPNNIKKVEVKETSLAIGMYVESDKPNTEDKYGNSLEWAGVFEGFNPVTDDKGNVVDYKSIFHDVLMEDEVYGRYVKSNVSENTPVMDSLLYAKDGPDDNDVRMVELSDNYMQLATNLEKDDYFDVRIIFGNGAEYIVLSGKKVENIDKEGSEGEEHYNSKSIYTKLSEAEILTMDSAIIETYINEGTKLYTTKYVDPSTQLFKETIEDYVKYYDTGYNDAKEFKLFEIANSKLPQDKQLTYDQYVALEPDEKTAFIKNVQIVDKDITNARITYFAQKAEEAKEGSSSIKEQHVKAIRAYKSSEDAAALNYYKTFRVERKTPLKLTYTVTAKMLEIVKNNPNLIDQVKSDFERIAQSNSRVDKLKLLETEYELAPEEAPAWGDSTVKTKKDIEQEIAELKGAIQNAFNTEAESQRTRRKTYIERLLAD